MRLDSLLCKPVYIITGLKIAKGFGLSGAENHASCFTAEVGGEVVPEASLGMRVDVSSSTSISD